MDFITGMFKGMFRMSAKRYQMRAKAKVRAKTVGRAQAKILKGRAALDKKVNKAQDKVFDAKLGKKGKGGKGAKGGKGKGGGGGGAPRAAGPAGGGGGGAGPQRGAPGRPPVGPAKGRGGGGAGPKAPVGPKAGGPPVGPKAAAGPGGRAAGPPAPGGRAAGPVGPAGGGASASPRAVGPPGGAPVGPGAAAAAAAPPASASRPGKRPPVGPAAQQQGANTMGKGKRNKNQVPVGQMTACGSCGAGLAPDWDICPYCGAGAGAGADEGYGYGYGYGQAAYGQAAPQPEPSAEKTVALNLDDLKKKKNRPVVGWIVAQNGNHRGMDFRLYDGKNLLGTAADCDIVITDPYLSAKHCTIRHEDGNFVLIDLDSTNGVFVNQKRVSTMELIDNDTVRLGRTEFKFKALF